MKQRLFCRLFASATIVGSFCSMTLRAATVTYSYDSLNRITNSAYSDGSSESYAYDAAGNRSFQIILAATNLLDVTKPSIPRNLVSTVFIASQLSIAWNRSVDTGGSGLAGYKILVNNSLVGTTTRTNFTLSGLFPNTQYCLSVAAFDHNENISDQSTNICFTTPVFQPPSLIPFGFASGHFSMGITGGTPGPYDLLGSSNLINWQRKTSVWLPLTNSFFTDPDPIIFSNYFYRLGWSTNTP